MPKAIEKNSRESTAIHEAGHAVLPFRLGFTPAVVSIMPRPGTDGHMLDDDRHSIDFEQDRLKSEQETAEDAAVVFYAGLAAEAHFKFVDYRWPRTPHSASNDAVLARTRLAEVVDESRELRLAVRRCRRRALALVRRYEADVRKLADALLEVETLTEGEIEAVLDVRSVAAVSGAETLSAKRAASRRRRNSSRGSV